MTNNDADQLLTLHILFVLDLPQATAIWAPLPAAEMCPAAGLATAVVFPTLACNWLFFTFRITFEIYEIFTGTK